MRTTLDIDADLLKRPGWRHIAAECRVMTSRRVMTRPLTAEQAIRIVDPWVHLEPVVLLYPGSDHWRIMKGLLERAGTAGNHTTDAHLAALAIEQDCELCSTDRDFGAFPDLRWINPLG